MRRTSKLTIFVVALVYPLAPSITGAANIQAWKSTKLSYPPASSNDDELREQLKALAVQYLQHASKNEGGTNINKRRGQIDALKKKAARLTSRAAL